MAALLALALLACAARFAAAASGATELTADNFDSLVGSKVCSCLEMIPANARAAVGGAELVCHVQSAVVRSLQAPDAYLGRARE